MPSPRIRKGPALQDALFKFSCEIEALNKARAADATKEEIARRLHWLEIAFVELIEQNTA
jgi:hypothetical protein